MLIVRFFFMSWLAIPAQTRCPLSINSVGGVAAFAFSINIASGLVNALLSSGAYLTLSIVPLHMRNFLSVLCLFTHCLVGHELSWLS